MHAIDIGAYCQIKQKGTAIVTKNIDDLKSQIMDLPIPDQWSLISSLVVERTAYRADQEVALCGPDEEPKFYLVPIRLWNQRKIETDAQSEIEVSDQGDNVPLSQVVKILSKGGSPDRVAQRLGNLRSK